MRRLTRPSLETRAVRYLARQQARIAGGFDVDAAWGSARRTKAMKGVATKLRSMTGARERCMYCWDSRGVDIEHYWPKSKYPNRAFDWHNFLSTCTGCNREKSGEFRLDTVGKPLLVSPVDTDPWDHLFFDSRTGLLTPRYLPRSDGMDVREDPRGQYTLAVIKTLKCEACVEGRQRTYRNLVRAVRSYIGARGGTDALTDFVAAVRDNDDYGLAVWFFTKDGQDEEPFAVLKKQHRAAWDAVASRCA